MTISKKNLTYLIVIIIVLLPAVVIRAEALEIVSETDARLSVKISFDETLDWRQSSDYPHRISSLTFGNSYQMIVNDHLSIPYYQWMIALPVSVQPTVTVTRTSYATVQLVQNVTAEDLAALKKLPWRALPESDIFGCTGSEPGDLSTQTGALANELSVLREIEVTINYPIIQQSGNPNSADRADHFQAFINSGSASNWRQFRAPQLKKSQSPPSGTWFRLTITEDGVYAVTRTDLTSLGLTATSIDTARIFLYSNSTGGRALTAAIGAEVPANLVENTRWIKGDGDGYLTASDTIIFWGRGSSGLAVNSAQGLTFERNPYLSVNYYWLLLADSPVRPKPCRSRLL
jgi:hypothetical protein